jgi:two-component system cell cycle sensor histidine kinase/response regulator CckA
MVASAQRGADLVTQLLAFAGGIRGERAPVRIDEIVSETRKLMEHTLPKSIRIETSSVDDCPQVLGDSTELSQVLMNLCINARDAMPDGGTLTIKSEVVCLDDNANHLNPDAHPGLYGMSADILDRIFDPFFTTKELGKGTGLGLATVQGIVKSHSGFINVYSELKHGTKFSIYLPAEGRMEDDTDLNGEGIEAAVRNSGRGYTVLLVDDELFILKMTATALEASGFRVITARDGAEAISTYSRIRDEITVVLLDMMMPGMDGLQTLEKLQSINPNVAVIACSGLRTTQREAEALDRGAKLFLPKPYSESQLLQALSAIL